MTVPEKVAIGCWTHPHRICSSKGTTDGEGPVDKGIAATQLALKEKLER